MATITSLSECRRVTFLTEDFIIFKDEGRVLEGFVAPSANKVLWMPHPPHGTSKWTPDGFVTAFTHSLSVHHLLFSSCYVKQTIIFETREVRLMIYTSGVVLSVIVVRTIVTCAYCNKSNTYTYIYIIEVIVGLTQ